MARKPREEPKETLSQRWTGELDAAGKEFDKWEETSSKIVRRYRDDRDVVNSRVRRFNILWSNVQLLKPSLYGRMPKPMVTRRFNDADPVGRVGSTMLQRCLEFEVEEYPDFNNTMRAAVEDRLLPGRGVAWVRYEPHFVEGEKAPDIAQVTPGTVTDDVPQQLDYECAPTDYVYWKDFLHEPGRNWAEVTWVARRVFMTHAEGEKRFGPIFALVPLQSEDRKKDSESQKNADKKKKAEVWEIWDKTNKTVIWIAKNFERELDMKPDPLGLEQFFPCPMPLFATVTTGSLVPVPDYCEYQDQAEELDTLTTRISKLTKACKVVGVYNAEFTALKRMLDEGVDNTMVPVTEWEAFSEKSGLKGSVQFLPLKEVIETLVQLYQAREAAKQVIYETIGLSDIMRGASQASETLGAQQLKAQFGSIRLKNTQEDVARFATDLLRMKAHIICTFFSDETILKMSGIEFTLDAEMAGQALALLREGTLKDFRIEVSADTLAQLDEAREKEERTEFLKATGSFLEKALPVIESQPAAGQLLGEMLMFGVRGFHVGRSVEAAFERAMAEMGKAKPAEGPPPEVQIAHAKEQAALQLANDNRMADQQKQLADMQYQKERDAATMAQKERLAQMESDVEMAKLAAEERKVQQEAELQSQLAEQERAHAAMMEERKRAADEEFNRWKAQLEADTKIVIAELSAKTSLKQSAISANASRDPLVETDDEGAEKPTNALEQLTEAINKNMMELMHMHTESHSKLVEAMQRPKTVMRGPDGRVMGVQ